MNEVNLGGSWAGSWASVSVCGSRGSAVDSTGETGTRSLHSKPMGGKAGDSGSTVGSGTRGLARGGESDARTGDDGITSGESAQSNGTTGTTSSKAGLWDHNESCVVCPGDNLTASGNRVAGGVHSAAGVIFREEGCA